MWRATASTRQGTARAATWPSAPRSTRACARTALWYPTGLHDGKLGKDADAGSLARASEIHGEMLLIFGTNDPHTPEEGRAVIKRGLEEAGVSFRWSLYEAEHAFGRDIGPRYDPRATDAAFAETVAVFNT